MLIYQIVHLDSGFRYIGQTTRPFIKRKREHLYPLRKNKHHNRYLQAAWNKYGEKSFEFQIVKEVSSLEELNEQERFIIANGVNLFNLADGGNAAFHDEAAKKMIGESNKKPIIGMNIKTYEVKRYPSAADASVDGFNASSIRVCVTGRSISNKGWVWMSKESGTLGALKAQCQVAKRSKVRKERAVIGMYIFNNKIISYPSSAAAARNGFNITNVHRACKSFSAVHRGYVWAFADVINPQSLLQDKRDFVLSKTRTGPNSWQYKDA